jgi:DNA replication licensing factor MCM7
MSIQVDQHPEVPREKEKCRDFLENFVYGGENVYRTQIQEIANRERRLLEINMDDVIDFKNDDEFSTNVERNTLRYVHLFEEAADSIMPQSLRQHEDDIFDILSRQRLSALRSYAGNDDDQPIVNDTPESLIRRFQVSIIPKRTEKVRKLREVKASDIGSLVMIKGLVTRATDVKPQVAVVTYTCDVCSSEIFQEVNGTQVLKNFF